MSFQVYFKGKQVRDAALLDRLSASHVGVFESMRTYDGRVFQADGHLKRLAESARTCGWKNPLNLTGIRKQMRQAIKAYSGEHPGKDCFLRVTLWDEKIYVMVGSRRHSEKIYREGVRLATSSVPRSHLNAWPAEVKTTAYQNCFLAGLPGSEKVYEWVLLDSSGYLAEVRIGNIFMVKQHGRTPHIWTPPTAGILNGVTRQFVIECALLANLKVHETPLMRSDIYNADEVFLTNTSWEILPVCELDGRRIGPRVPGNITKKLHRLFRERVKQQCQR